MLDIIRHNLKHIASFGGRQPARIFWPYVGLVFALNFVAMFAVMLPGMLKTFSRIQRYAAEHPEQARVTAGPGHYSIEIKGAHPELIPDIRFFSAAASVVSLLTVLLLAAAVARRLHDRDLSGLWGLLPLPFLAFGIVAMPRAFEAQLGGELQPGSFFLLFFNNMIYLAFLALLGVLLARRGTPGPNRYGPSPEDLSRWSSRNSIASSAMRPKPKVARSRR